MSSLTWPDHLLSLAEWADLPVPEDRHYELVDGVLLVSPRPSGRHQRAIMRLAAAIDAQLPRDLTALPEAELVIDAGTVATVRVPDILVTRYDLVEQHNLVRYGAGDVLLVVEIVSPGSRSTDRVSKVAEYANAGIASYWILDLEAGTITVLQAEEGVYVPLSQTGIAEVTTPVPLRIDLAEVLAQR